MGGACTKFAELRPTQDVINGQAFHAFLAKLDAIRSENHGISDAQLFIMLKGELQDLLHTVELPEVERSLSEPILPRGPIDSGQAIAAALDGRKRPNSRPIIPINPDDDEDKAVVPLTTVNLANAAGVSQPKPKPVASVAKSRLATMDNLSPTSQLANLATTANPNARYVLVVDDSQISLRLAERTLQSLRFTPITCKNATLALEVLVANPRLFCFVLLDIIMEGTDGISLLHQIKSTPSLVNLVVIMQSGLEDEKLKAICLATGAACVLVKPVKMDMLKDILKNRLGITCPVDDVKDDAGAGGGNGTSGNINGDLPSTNSGIERRKKSKTSGDSPPIQKSKSATKFSIKEDDDADDDDDGKRVVVVDADADAVTPPIATSSSSAAAASSDEDDDFRMSLRHKLDFSLLTYINADRLSSRMPTIVLICNPTSPLSAVEEITNSLYQKSKHWMKSNLMLVSTSTAIDGVMLNELRVKVQADDDDRANIVMASSSFIWASCPAEVAADVAAHWIVVLDTRMVISGLFKHSVIHSQSIKAVLNSFSPKRANDDDDDDGDEKTGRGLRLAVDPSRSLSPSSSSPATAYQQKRGSSDDINDNDAAGNPPQKRDDIDNNVSNVTGVAKKKKKKKVNTLSIGSKRSAISMKSMGTNQDLPSDAPVIIIIDDSAISAKVTMHKLSKIGFRTKYLNSGRDAINLIRSTLIRLKGLDLVAVPSVSQANTMSEAESVVTVASNVSVSFPIEVHQDLPSTKSSPTVDSTLLRRLDLVVLDLVMPDLDGYAVLNLLMNDPLMKEIPVVIVSGVEDAQLCKICCCALLVLANLLKEKGAKDVLTKPIQMDKLKIVLNGLHIEIPNDVD